MFGRSIPLFRLAGFQVGIDWSWPILAVLITWTLSVQVFPYYYPGLTAEIYWSMGVVAALGLFASIVLHELGHSLAARRYNVPIRGITLFIFGGVAEMEREPDRPWAELVIAIAGPIASFLVGVVCWLLLQAAVAVGASLPVAGVFAYLASINVVLAVFNLVPAFPLDGGRIFRALLWAWKGSLRWATRIASIVGGGFGILLVAFGVYRAVTGDLTGGIWSALLGLFVYVAAQASYQQVLMREGLRGIQVRRIMTPNPVVVPPGISIAQLIDDYLYRYHHKMFPVVEDRRLVGCVSLDDIKAIPREQWASATISSIMQPCTPATAVAPDADAMDVLSTMHQAQNSRLLVTEGDRLVGVITLKDMLEFLSIKLELEEPRKAGVRFAAGAKQAKLGEPGLSGGD